MAETCELLPAAWVTPDGSIQRERRRPGRVEVHPHLIPLLRGQVETRDDSVSQAATPDFVIRDDLGAAVGVFHWVAVCLAGWACAGFLLLN